MCVDGNCLCEWIVYVVFFWFCERFVCWFGLWYYVGLVGGGVGFKK